MQRLIDLFLRRPVFASMTIAALVVLGAASFLRLRIDRFPAVDMPTVTVRTVMPGAATEEVESLVSRRIEDVVNTIEGIDQLRSISTSGVSIVVITFALERDIDVAAQDVRDRVATVLKELPVEAEPPVVSKFDNDQTPALTLALSADRPLRELTELADKTIRPAIERAPGVGGVTLVGGALRSINVWIDAARLRAYGLPITAVRDALQRQNAELPGGNVTKETHEAVLRTLGQMNDPRDFDELVVATIGGAPIRVRDVGHAEDGTKEPRSLARLDGHTCLSLEVRRQSGANAVEVIDGVKERLERLRAQLPPDVKVEVIRDQSRYIHAALHEITVHLILGSILASLVVLAFMRSWRSTLIAAIAIPCSTIATFALMKALGFTLNGVTMLALVLMVGIVIDDAIVVLENIWRFIEEKGMTPRQAAAEGTAEIALAVMATTLSLAVIFIPVSFMSSISGRFLYQFGITAAAAVLVSLLVSFILTPMMCARLLRPSAAARAAAHAAASRSGLYSWVERGYLALLKLALRFRIVVLLLALGVIAWTVPLYHRVKQEYTPTDVDESEFEISIIGPEGASLAATDDAMQQLAAELRALPEVKSVLVTIGGSFLNQVNRAEVYVRLAPLEERQRTQRDVMGEARQRLARFGDLRCAIRNVPGFNIGGGNFDIDFSILGPDLEGLAKYGEQLRLKAKEVGGIADPDLTLRLDRPELRVIVDRDRAADLGVEIADVAGALRLMVGGEEKVSRWRDTGMGEDYDVALRLDGADRADAGSIAQLFVPGKDASGATRLVRLDNVGHLERGTTASRVDRLDRERQVSLRASVLPGFALGDRLDALRGAAASLDMPPAYSTKISGRGRELEKTFTEFLWAFLLSVILMYLILASQFESLVHPLTILFSIPLSIPFALWSLDVSGNTLNLYSALGILVLFGVVKKNAILQIDHANQLREKGMAPLEATLTANRDRLRPILMTTLALVAGMLPLALGTGPGAEERRAVAVVVIGGQTLSLLLTLIVTPVVDSTLGNLKRRP